jgi:hypothetical protein
LRELEISAHSCGRGDERTVAACKLLTGVFAGMTVEIEVDCREIVTV